MNDYENKFQKKALIRLKSSGTSFGMNQTFIDKVLPVAHEKVIHDLLSHCSPEDQVTFKNAYLIAPDVVDCMEFLEFRVIGSFETLFNEYFDRWLREFRASLK